MSPAARQVRMQCHLPMSLVQQCHRSVICGGLPWHTCRNCLFCMFGPCVWYCCHCNQSCTCLRFNVYYSLHCVLYHLYRWLAVQMVVKCADIGHLAASPRIHRQWAYQLEEEFFRQVRDLSFVNQVIVLHLGQQHVTVAWYHHSSLCHYGGDPTMWQWLHGC